MAEPGISTASTRLLSCLLGPATLGLPTRNTAPSRRLEVRACSPVWRIGLPHNALAPPLSPGRITLALPAFVALAAHGSLWSALLLWGTDDIVSTTRWGAELRRAAEPLAAKTLLLRALATEATRDLRTATTRRRRPLSVVDERDLYSRALVAAHIVSSVATTRQVQPVDDPTRHVELSTAAAHGHTTARVEIAATARRAARTVDSSTLREHADSGPLHQAAATIQLTVTTRDEQVGVVRRDPRPAYGDV